MKKSESKNSNVNISNSRENISNKNNIRPITPNNILRENYT